jgi:NADPH-dependent 2,4-dienoyl-CoA reductase/sulfur reductase-like enzyme
MANVVIIGGNAAGMTAAGRAARLDPALEVSVLEQGPHVAYSICGAPYFLSGEVRSLDDLVLYTPEEFSARNGVRVLTGTRVEAIDLPRRRVLATDGAGQELAFPYDRLLLATGGRGMRLGVAGEEAANIHSLATLGDAARIGAHLAAGVRTCLLVGGGLVNLELADALARRGIDLTLVEREERILPGLDPEMAELVEAEVARRGVRLWKGRSVRTFFAGPGGAVESAWVEGIAERVPADLVLVDVGARPEVRLAEAAGLRVGISGGIAVTERLETSAAGVWAAGNCAETVHLVSNRPLASALGTAANKQGRVAGENLAGRPSTFRGVLDTWVVRVFDLTVARTGLTEEGARACGFQPVAVRISAPARAAYFSGPAPLTVRALADRRSRRLLGLQAIGPGADKRVDVAAVALTASLGVDEASQLDLAYAPPYGAVVDPFLVAMNALARSL